jgi:hypothetical protein
LVNLGPQRIIQVMRDFVLKDLPLGVGWKTSPRKGNILLSSSKSFFPITGMPAASHRIPRDSDEGTNGCDDQVMAGGRKVASSFDSHLRNCLKSLVPLAGLEPARCFHHLILSQARLPIPPQGHGAGIIPAVRAGSTPE